uniref:Uncharacterized protein n=1 Tax=Arundo donax TaxID=35708 RepID=A0A0A8ZRD3_ARUDO
MRTAISLYGDRNSYCSAFNVLGEWLVPPII